MATHYVDSAASGANNGTSKTDAWTSLASATGVAAGDEIRLAKTHSQNPGASASYNFSNSTVDGRVRIIVMDFSDDSYSPAASAQFSGAASDLNMTGRFTVAGLYLGVADDSTWTTSGFFLDCTFQTGDNFSITAFSGEVTEFESCTFNATGNFNLQSVDTSTTIFRDCVFTSPSTLNLTGEGGFILFEDCDLSAVSTLFATIPAGARVVLRRCKVHASLAIGGTSIAQGSSVVLEACDDGNITVPVLPRIINYYGEVQATTARYRTGGADDGFQANEHSFELASNAKALETYKPLKVTLTRRIAADGSISSATARGIFTSTRCAPLATPAALATDATSTWNGTNVGTKQEITHTLTNGATLTVYVASAGTLNNDDFWIEVHEPDQVGGPLSVVACLAKPSTTVYVDPKIEVSGANDGEVYFVEGVQVMDETSGGGGASMMRPVSQSGGLV